jgi:hypothetical protein
MTEVAPAEPPREPEIEALARAARGFLWLLRRVFWVAGAAAIAYGLWRSGTPDEPPLEGALPVPALNALGTVWLCAGLPLLLPSDWLTNRRGAGVLAASLVLWLLPCWLPGDHSHGYVLRIVATFCSSASLLVWRTLWRLTAATAPR